ncbi:deoxyribose-phosphate aldolase [Salibacterium qingdaonense]|uniref:Deoxyribose-phosphate aldolase n=1 Tax=Salibacterium qingdaonense TaxID=266892 RepID=A0A1I4Q8L6_9BACI|nr:deoxyribose-phosphate aldolase [Salibacterium qingdaonense]SFM36394.1 deoxyribose-phosphate aldolase [Salibacterium qingdaonense]
MNREEFCARIDYSILWQNRTRDSIEKRSREVLDYGFACLCCYPTDVAFAKKVIGDKARISGVIGFPFGFETTETKVHEALAAIDQGADEIDMVMNIARFKDGDDDYVLDELKQVVQAAKNRKKDCMVKVIIETPHLKSRKELEKACGLVIESGADFVKNATGFAAGYDGTGKADYQDNSAETYENTGIDNVKAMSEIVDGRINIKSSGAPQNLKECLYYVKELGVSRIGNDNIIEWLDEAGENFWKTK